MSKSGHFRFKNKNISNQVLGLFHFLFSLLDFLDNIRLNMFWFSHRQCSLFHKCGVPEAELFYFVFIFVVIFMIKKRWFQSKHALNKSVHESQNENQTFRFFWKSFFPKRPTNQTPSDNSGGPSWGHLGVLWESVEVPLGIPIGCRVVF